MKVLITPDKFKGTLSAAAAAEAIARGWRKTRPQDSLRLEPMTDGGDGFGDVLSGCLHAKSEKVKTLDAAHRPCEARWWWAAGAKTALIDSSAVIGLAMLPVKKFHPFQLDTFGLGVVLRAVASKGARRCLVGIGGSATNDGGFGVARAMGWEFLKQNGEFITHWTDLEDLIKIRLSKNQPRIKSLQVAVDVQNPLLGPHGATRIYGPQKGLRPKDFDLAERCLKRLAQIVRKQFGRDFAREPGAGAAGGLGFGLCAFFGARLVPGFELFAKIAKLKKHLHWADLVITGEGSIDHSTFMGKGVGQIARRCQKLKLPCIGIGGVVSKPAQKHRGFTEIRALTELTTPESAKKNANFWLERLASHCARAEFS